MKQHKMTSQIENPISSKTIKILLTETETIFLFERASTTAAKDTEEGTRSELSNQTYGELLKNDNRRVNSNETQTEATIMGVKLTEIPRVETKSSYAFASIWDMHDSFAVDKTDQQIAHSAKIDETSLVEYPPFADAVIITERVLANNIFKDRQEKFKRIFKEEREIDVKESMYLCSLECCEIKDTAVTGMCLNSTNEDLVAIGYGKYYYNDIKAGTVGIWSIKNLIRPERLYEFSDPVTCLEFSSENPHLLAIGFYNGDVIILDITSYEKKIIAQTNREVNPSYKPIWQIKWLNNEILTVGEDGRVMRFKCTKSKDFIGSELMRIKQPVNVENARNCSCLIVTFHPTKKDIYFVGTKEGFVYKCSVNLLNGYIEAFLAHDGPINTMQFSAANRKIFLTSGADWTVKLWLESLTQEPLIVLTLNNPPECASFSPTHPTIIAAIGDESLFLWDLKNTFDFLLVEKKLKHNEKLTKMMFTEDGRNLIVGDIAGNSHIYNLHYVILGEIDSRPSNTIEHCIRKKLTVKPELLKVFNKVI